MKKVILSLSIVAMATMSTMAQTEKNTLLLGGNAAFGSMKEGLYKATAFQIAPMAGVFVMDNLAVGAKISYSSYKPESSDASTSFEAGPYVRYYFVPLGKNAKLFGDASILFGSDKSGGGSSQSYTDWQISAGPAFFLNPSVALEVALGYGSSKYKDATDAMTTFGINVGFQIHFKCKK